MDDLIVSFFVGEATYFLVKASGVNPLQRFHSAQHWLHSWSVPPDQQAIRWVRGPPVCRRPARYTFKICL